MDCTHKPSGEQRNFVEKHYLTLFILILKLTSVFTIYIHNIHYIILISLPPWRYIRWNMHTTTDIQLVLRLGYTSSTHTFKAQFSIK